MGGAFTAMKGGVALIGLAVAVREMYYLRCRFDTHVWIRHERFVAPVHEPLVAHECTRCGKLWVGMYKHGFDDGDNPPIGPVQKIYKC